MNQTTLEGKDQRKPQQSKKELLNQLKIADGDDQAATGLSWQWVIGIALVTFLGGALLSYVVLRDFSPVREDTQPVDEITAEPSASMQPNRGAEEGIAVRGAAVDENIGSSSTPTESPILDASGYITARRVATVSSEVTGLITNVLVEEGMDVEAGQILAQLDASEAEVGLQLAKAELAVQQARLDSLKADLAEAKRVLRRISRLEINQFSSKADLTRAQTDMDIAQSALNTTNADIKVSEWSIAQQQEYVDNHTIRAPFRGVVTEKNAQPGEIVSPTSAGGGFTRTGICTIVDMDSLEIEVDVNEAFIGRVYPRQKVIAQLDAYPDWKIPASVIAIIPTADRSKATVRVRIKLGAKDKRILPNMGVKVAFYH